MDNKEMSRGDTMLISIGAGSIIPKLIRIGYEGENVVTQVDFNLKKWIAEYGLGGVTLLVIRHGDTDAYPVPLIIKDGIASWSITQTDTAKAGRGAIQLVYTVGEKIKKSPILDISCLNALDDSDAIPDPYDTWLAALTDLSALVTAKASAAATSETNAVTAAQTATTKASEAAASATSAQEYDESAQASAVNAQTSATNAAASEAQAQEYAENASAYLMTDTEATDLLDIAKGVA